MRFHVKLVGKRLRKLDRAWELFQLQDPKTKRSWKLRNFRQFFKFSHHTVHMEHVTIVNVVLKIFGNVCKMGKIFGVLTRAINVLHTVLANHSLTVDVNELNTVVRYRQTNGTFHRMYERCVVGRRRWYHTVSFLELLNRFSSRFCASKLFYNGWSEILERRKKMLMS